MSRTDFSAAANARVVPTVEYEIDRRGWGFFARISRIRQRDISGAGARAVIMPFANWGGDARSKQRFTGLGRLEARPSIEPTREMADERQAYSPSLDVFAERMGRRR